jgi:hypothetical protein
LEEKMMMKKGKFMNLLSLKQAELEKMKKGEKKKKKQGFCGRSAKTS